jgi:DNA-binding HxlR family transcriptional regulator
LAMVGLP